MNFIFAEVENVAFLHMEWRQKGRDLTQSYDISPYSNGNSNGWSDNTNNETESSITQRLQTDLERSVEVQNTKRKDLFHLFCDQVQEALLPVMQWQWLYKKDLRQTSWIE